MSPVSERWLAAMESQTTVAGGGSVLEDFLMQPNADADTAIALLAVFRHLCTKVRRQDVEYVDRAFKNLEATVLSKVVTLGDAVHVAAPPRSGN